MLSNTSLFAKNSEFKRYLYVLIGATSLALGVVLFLIPNKIVPGGTPGISILLNHFTGLPAGFLMFCVNVPLVLLSMKYIDKGFAYRTIFSIFVSSSVVDILREVLEVSPWTNDAMLGGIFGGVFIGIGLGFLISGNASAGGPSIIARIVADKMQWKQSTVIIALDIIIVVAAGFVFQSIESALWSLVSVYSTFKSMDTLISGGPTKKIIHISSTNVEDILNDLKHKQIILENLGFDLNENQKVITLVVENNKVREIKQIVKSYDPTALMIVMEAVELLGKE